MARCCSPASRSPALWLAWLQTSTKCRRRRDIDTPIVWSLNLPLITVSQQVPHASVGVVAVQCVPVSERLALRNRQLHSVKRAAGVTSYASCSKGHLVGSCSSPCVYIIRICRRCASNPVAGANGSLTSQLQAESKCRRRRLPYMLLGAWQESTQTV